jgi:predicted Zn-dependent protease
MMNISMIKEAHRMSRRQCLKFAGIAGILISTNPLYAFNIFDVIDPEGKSKDIQRAKRIFEAADSLRVSATGLDYKSEFSIGESLALEGFRRYGMPVADASVQKYVNLVGTSVARNSLRPDIPYYFVAVDSPLYNAFSCPGGIIFISSTLIKGMKDEAELAGVLSHEVAHVGHKHALQSIRRAKFFEGVGKISDVTMGSEKGKEFRAMIDDLQTRLFDQGLDQNMEFEADMSALHTAYRTGYNPKGFVNVLQMLETKKSAATKAGSWFSTHPPLSMRIVKCRQKLKSYPDADTLANAKDRFTQYLSRF